MQDNTHQQQRWQQTPKHAKRQPPMSWTHEGSPQSPDEASGWYASTYIGHGS
jgi:hypothetical protein